MTFNEFLLTDVVTNVLNNKNVLQRIYPDSIEWYLLGIGFKKQIISSTETKYICSKNNKEYSISINISKEISLEELQQLIYMVGEATHKNHFYILQSLFTTSELRHGSKSNA